MMDNKMVVEGSLQNHVEGDAVTGFSFEGRLPYYRGLGLSMVEDVQVAIDGEKIAREDIRVCLHGNCYSLDEMETVYDDRWNFGEKATIIALKEGGLSEGSHTLEYGVRMRVSYLPFVPTTKDTKELMLAA